MSNKSINQEHLENPENHGQNYGADNKLNYELFLINLLKLLIGGYYDE